MLAAVLVVGGLGGAAFHPSAAAVVHRLGGRGAAWRWRYTSRRASIGYALGPLLFAPYVQRFGLGVDAVARHPGPAVLALILPRLPRHARRSATRGSGGMAALRPYARPLFLL